MSEAADFDIWSYLPTGPGYLPPFLLFLSVVSIGNSIQTYLTTHFNKRIYSGQPFQINGLSSRTFGTWTTLAAIVRFYAAYNISNQPLYDVTIATYLVAGFHFYSEWLYFGTARLGDGLTGPLIAATAGGIWMLSQREYYLSQ